jgi:WXG100 family type VII secretion target
MTFSPEDLGKTATEFEQAGRQSQAVLTRLEKATQELEKNWGGAGKDAFFSHYKEWRKLMEGQVTLLTTIALELRAAATKYDKADL